MNPTTRMRIKDIFDNTIVKIINTMGGQELKYPVGSDTSKFSVELLPILQSFLMDIQLYQASIFNSIINEISADISEQSLVSNGGIQQPQVSNSINLPVNNTGNIMKEDDELTIFAKSEINDSNQIWNPVMSNGFNDEKFPKCLSDSRKFQDLIDQTNSLDDQSTFDGLSINNTSSNYDEFLDYYSSGYAKYNETYVDDSSDSQAEDEPNQIIKYGDIIGSPDAGNQTSYANGISSSDNIIESVAGKYIFENMDKKSGDSGKKQCCARLSKYMKYKISDLGPGFMRSYPPDTYIENGFVIGMPCPNKVEDNPDENHFCQEHINDVAIEDIRKPRADTDIYNLETDENAGSDIIFNEKGYYSNTGKHNVVWDDINYYGSETNHIEPSNEMGGGSFNGVHQCCARLNKFRVYRLEFESPEFLNTYPDNVYIEDGCVYGNACQNLISDESYYAGIRFCINHESDPYVENICEPSKKKNMSSYKHTPSHLGTLNTKTFKDTTSFATSIGLEEHILNPSQSTDKPNQTDKYSSGKYASSKYYLDKYNSDFSDLM